MGTLAWLELLVGFLGIFTILMSFKIYQLAKFWKNSFYTEIYSSFIEFLFRRKSLTKMSTSYWLGNELGDHRIMFQMAHSQNNNIPQAYIIIALSSGLYFLQIKNYTGQVKGVNHNNFQLKRMSNNKNKAKSQNGVIKIANPIKELSHFIERWNQLMDIDSSIYQIIVFSDECQIDIDPLLTNNTITINRKAMFATIKNLHQNNLSSHSVNVDEIYNKFSKIF